MADNRRTQAERAAETREALIAAARPLFAELGFAEVALESIVRAAGVTRGALYHHFADKTELFAAVFEQVEGEVAARMGEAIAATNEADPIEVMRLGASFWLDVCRDAEIRRITLADAPAVLGWTRWNEIGNRYNTGLVRGLLANAVEIGRIPPQPIEATTLTLLGAMREATFYVAMADEPDQARQDAGLVIDRLIHALARAATRSRRRCGAASRSRRQAPRLVVRHSDVGEHLVVERDGCILDRRPAEAGYLHQRGAAVGRMRDAFDESVGLQSPDRVRDAGDVHLQPVGRLGDRQRTGAAERQQPQQFVTGETQVVGPQRVLHAGQQDLVRPHHRRHRDHPVRDIAPSGAFPVGAGQRDRVTLIRESRGHASSYRTQPAATGQIVKRIAIAATAASTARVDARLPTVIRTPPSA